MKQVRHLQVFLKAVLQILDTFQEKKSSKGCFYGNSTKTLSWEVSEYSE